MALHLPYSVRPEDEFQMPDGSWHYVLRAVAHDGWLFWKHALPDELDLRAHLTHSVVSNITDLGNALHSVHQRFCDLSDLGDTPFTVGRWWDPTDTSGEWHEGRRILLRLDGYSAADLILMLRGRTFLEGEPVSTNWAEIRLRMRPRPARLEPV